MHRLLFICSLIAFLPARARCQAARAVSDGYLDLGGAFLSQPGLPSTSVLTAAGQFRFATPSFALAMNGIEALTSDGRYTGQGVISASRYAAPTHRVRWELGGTTSAFGLSNAPSAFGWQILAREHLGWSLGGVFAGAAGGVVAENGVSHPIVNAHTGGFVRFDETGRDEISAAVAYTDAPVFPDSASRLRYADAIGYWTHRTRRLELLVGGGVRAQSLAQPTPQSWGSATAVIWFAPGAGIVLSGGRALADAARGVPSARYVSAAIRLGGSNGLPGMVAQAGRERPDEDGGGGRIDVNVGGDSLRIVTVRLRSANTVELMADFTDWEPVSMTLRPNGDWTVERILAPGTHRVAIRVNGGVWAVPPNLPHVADEFGGEVGLLIVP